MKIYTKTGDKGTTALLGGIRVSKAHLRIDAYGTIDELNANIGLLNDQEVNQKRAAKLKAVQEALFVIGADLATAPEKQSVKKPVLGPGEVEMLENEIDAMEEQLEPLTRFILPGGHQVVSYCHLARTVCRRAERCVIALHEQEPVDEIILLYLNRLSDFLFVLGRFVAKELKVEEITWDTRN